MKNSRRRMICTFLLCSSAFAPAQDTAQAPSGGPTYQPVNIARIKADYYQKQGFELLPEFIDDSTIGPGQFVAINNTTIRKGAGLTVNPGTTIWFEPQRRLIIEGSLMAASTDKERIRLTYLPIKMRYIKIVVADSLWNGIAVEPGGNLFLNRIVLNNATTGISVTGDIDRLDMACVDMSDRVATPVLIDGKPVAVANPGCISTGDLKAEALPPADSSHLRHNATRAKIALRVGSCVVAAGGLGMAVYGASQYRKYALLYEQSTDPARYSPEEVDGYRAKALQGGRLGLAGGIIGILGIAGFTLTWVF